jgi:hypothetical protein
MAASTLILSTVILLPVFDMRHYTTGFKNRFFAARIYQDALFFFMHERLCLDALWAHQAVNRAFNVDIVDMVLRRTRFQKTTGKPCQELFSKNVNYFAE